MDVSILVTMVCHQPCFRLARHALMQVGHAGAMLQARRLGEQLFVGVHSDEDIFNHKGPTVMTLEERSVTSESQQKVEHPVILIEQ